MTKWHVGAFGRFAIENPKYPRFEVVGVDKPKAQVLVWYSGHPKPMGIPVATFMADCVNWWEVEILGPFVKIPQWLHPDGSFTLESPNRAINVIVTQIGETSFSRTTQCLDVKGRNMQFRRRHGDYVSCLCDQPESLILIPLKVVLEFGRPVTTAWDLLRTRDILDPEDELF